MPIILGIDPGSRVTGYGVIETQAGRNRYIASGCIRTTGLALPSRLQQIFVGISEVMAQFKPDEMAIEEVFFHRNPSSALKLGQARGAAIVAASTLCSIVAEYSTRQIKQSVVGYGAAKKEQVQQMVKSLLNLSGVPQADAADALAVALCHGHARTGVAAICKVQGFKQGRMR